MQIFLGGHLSFYHPQKKPWLEVDIQEPVLLTAILEGAGIPLGEVHMVTVDDKIVDLQKTIISPHDQVKLYSAVGGG